MNWNQLQYVITIAEEKSITKAAKKLFISQPSLSLSLQALEHETGVSLFDRSHGEVSLTYAGTLFYDWAVSTLRSNRQLNLKLNDISNQTRHLIKIGISPHRSMIMLPPVLEQFYKEFPNCEVHIVEKPTFMLKKLLEDNEIDFMIDVAHPDTINYQSDLLVREEILLAVPQSYTAQDPFSVPGPVSLSGLSAFPFIMLSADQVLGSMSRRMCEAAALHPDIRLSCTNIETALTLVGRQLGITFVPEVLSKQPRFRREIRYYSILQFHDARQICLVYRKNLYRPTQMTALLEQFRRTIPELY